MTREGDARMEVEEEVIATMDRAYRGRTQGVVWPLSDVAALHPVEAMLAWGRAGARDVRCLWFVVHRYGAGVMADALDEVAAECGDEAAGRAAAWLHVQAGKAWLDEQPVVRARGVAFRVDACGARIWEG